jgi:hypothetical protein
VFVMMLMSRLLLTCASLVPCHQRAAHPYAVLSDISVANGRRSAICVGLGAICALRAPCTVQSVEVATTAADIAYATADVVACRSYIRRVLDLIRSEPDIAVINSVLTRPPFSAFGAAAETLINGPSNLDPNQRAAIQSSPYSDSLNLLKQSVAAGDEKQAKADAKAVQRALDDVLAELSAAGLL